MTRHDSLSDDDDDDDYDDVGDDDDDDDENFISDISSQHVVKGFFQNYPSRR